MSKLSRDHIGYLDVSQITNEEHRTVSCMGSKNSDCLWCDSQSKSVAIPPMTDENAEKRRHPKSDQKSSFCIFRIAVAITRYVVWAYILLSPHTQCGAAIPHMSRYASGELIEFCDAIIINASVPVTLNVYVGDSIAFHFNPREDSKVVVRNTYRGGWWQWEERVGGWQFSEQSRPAMFEFTYATTSWEVSYNGERIPDYDYNHRMFGNITDIQAEGDATANIYIYRNKGTRNADCDASNACRAENQFQCRSGECIIRDAICDHYEDCADASDETYAEVCESVDCTSYMTCDLKWTNCVGSNVFQCDSGVCINGARRCDNRTDCWEGADEKSCSYYCESNDIGSISIEKLQTQFGLDDEKSQTVMNIANTFVRLGVNVQDSVLLVLLLFVNIIPSVFILIGLCLYDQMQGFEHITVSYIMFVIVVLQHLLIMSMHVFYQPSVQCYAGILPTYSWFDVLCGCICATLIGLWFHHTYRGTCSKYYKVVVWLLVVALPIVKQNVNYYVNCEDHASKYDCGSYEHIQQAIIAMNKFTAFFSVCVFAGLQLVLPICWTVMVNKQMIKSIWGTKIPKCEHVCASISKCTGNVCLWVVFLIVIMVWAYFRFLDIGMRNEMDISVRCVEIAFQTGAFAPIFFSMMALDIYLCLSGSKAFYPTAFYIFIQSIIALFGTIEDSVCYYVLNIQYIALSMFVPIYIIIIFWMFKELNRWKTGLISMYLISFDLISDVFVIYQFLQNHDYQFAVLQIAFMIFGQTIGAFSGIWSDHGYQLNVLDRILNFLGFSDMWFLIKSWTETELENKYKNLYQKHKIWEIMYQSTPSLALQVYALFVTETSPFLLVSSAALSMITVTVDISLYLAGAIAEKDKTDKSNQVAMDNAADDAANANATSNTIEELRKLDHESGKRGIRNKLRAVCEGINRKFAAVLDHYQLFFRLFPFLISDFYLRTIPIIVTISAIDCDDNQSICAPRTAGFVLIFGGISALELIFNWKMRKECQSWWFILETCWISTLSSFYVLFSCLKVLSNEKAFGCTVMFKMYELEHKVR
eukprot:909271_1